MKKNALIMILATLVMSSSCSTISKVIPGLGGQGRKAYLMHDGKTGQQQPSQQQSESQNTSSKKQEIRFKSTDISKPIPQEEQSINDQHWFEDVDYPETIEEPVDDGLTELQHSLIRIAKSKIGSRYSYSAKGPDAFDCSGFMMYVFGQKGIKLSPGSRVQYTQGRPIRKNAPLKPCDLVFFAGRKASNTVGHVGMVLDYDRKTKEFTFIHASTSNGVEIQRSSAEYYAKRYIGARRILTDGEFPDYDISPGAGAAAAAAEEEEAPVEAVQTEVKPTEDTQSEVKQAEEPQEVWHTIKSGDTLSGIAVKYHSSVSTICRLNGISTKTILKIGRKLRVK